VGIRGWVLALHVQCGVALERIHRVASICHGCCTLLMRDTEAIQNLKSILRGTLRILTDDNRAFIGTFVGTDKSLNILLLNTEEFRLGADANPAGRYVGQVMIPWRLIRDIGLQVASEGGSYSEQVRVRRFTPTDL
jgi:small nuclear ribonucleoprotein (snRNP)-like protein